MREKHLKGQEEEGKWGHWLMGNNIGFLWATVEGCHARREREG